MAFQSRAQPGKNVPLYVPTHRPQSINAPLGGNRQPGGRSLGPPRRLATGYIRARFGTGLADPNQSFAAYPEPSATFEKLAYPGNMAPESRPPPPGRTRLVSQRSGGRPIRGTIWTDYRTNWESTLHGLSLLQPDVWQYEVAPWAGKNLCPAAIPRNARPDQRQAHSPPPTPPELQVRHAGSQRYEASRTFNGTAARKASAFSSATALMFQAGGRPAPSDPNMAHFYGLAPSPPEARSPRHFPCSWKMSLCPVSSMASASLLVSYQGQKPLFGRCP